MGVLCATLITFLTAVLLPERKLFGEQDVYLRLLALILPQLRGLYVVASHYSGWGDRTLGRSPAWYSTLTYFFNWELYAIQWDPENYAVLTEPQGHLQLPGQSGDHPYPVHSHVRRSHPSDPQALWRTLRCRQRLSLRLATH